MILIVILAKVNYTELLLLKADADKHKLSLSLCYCYCKGVSLAMSKEAIINDDHYRHCMHVGVSLARLRNQALLFNDHYQFQIGYY